MDGDEDGGLSRSWDLRRRAYGEGVGLEGG